ncbi:hypothetical protein LCGC14_2161420 [marine sediment metagenome]|uniref:Uncharacterized protein n=1 Tax=marine sediment metagenome TaxID=412755 RepID=A0A0F9G5G8_9ZZZZ
MALRMRTERIHRDATQAREPARRGVPGLRRRHGRVADHGTATWWEPWGTSDLVRTTNGPGW